MMIEDQATRPGTARDVPVAVRSYFATPVALIDMPNADVLGRGLRAAIEAREKTDPGSQHSNLGGWQSHWDFTEWGGAAWETIRDAAASIANGITCDRTGMPVAVDWRFNAWANVNRDGHANEFHTHPGCFWSGTYYVDDGGVHDDPSLGGEFEIQDPRGVAPAMYAPLLAYTIKGGLSVGAAELIRPKTGMIMIFPSWLSHGVRPYHGTGTRISIAFNMSL